MESSPGRPAINSSLGRYRFYAIDFWRDKTGRNAKRPAAVRDGDVTAPYKQSHFFLCFYRDLDTLMTKRFVNCIKIMYNCTFVFYNYYLSSVIMICNA